MSPRRARPRTAGGPPPAGSGSFPSGSFSTGAVEEWPDGDWLVRRVTGSASAKTYRCPGCDHEIRPATPHLVAWPAEGRDAEEHRRHWHAPCWRSRGRRGVKVHRAKNAPRHG